MKKKKIKEQKPIQLWFGCKKCKYVPEKNETNRNNACPKCKKQLSINSK